MYLYWIIWLLKVILLKHLPRTTMTHTVFSMLRGPMLSSSRMISFVIFCKSNLTRIMNKDGSRIIQLVLLLIPMSFCRTLIANSSISSLMRNINISIWIIFETFICSSLIIHLFYDTLEKILWATNNNTFYSIQRSFNSFGKRAFHRWQR